jgi:uncharacterized protein YlxP (DUF503 family)
MVGAARIELFLASCQSLKDKRAIVKSMIARLRQKFNVSVAETDFLEQWQRTELTVAAVANEMSFLQKELQSAIRLVESTPEVELLHADTEYYE